MSTHTNKKLWTKRQVRHILRMLKENKKDRPALSCININKEGYLEMTDGYQMHLSKRPLFKEMEEPKLIMYDDLEKWYKQADRKAMLSTQELSSMMKTSGMVYPQNLRRLIRDELETTEIGLNVKYLNIFTEILGIENMKIKLTGSHSMIKSSNDLFESVLLPVRIYD